MYMYKKDLTSNYLQWLISHKTKPNQTNTFPKGISSKVNVTEGLEFELTYYDLTEQHVSHNTTSPLSFTIFVVSQKFKSKYY